MAGFFERLNPYNKHHLFGGMNKKTMEAMGGTPASQEQISRLTPEQQKIQAQLENAAMQQGAGGAYGTSADYYRDLLSDNPQDMQAFAAPEMRKFNEEIIPQLSEQFAGMGAGGLSSSSFRNAAVNEGSSLSERLGAMRANLRQQGAQGLFNIGQASLNPVVDTIYNQPQPGFLEQVGPELLTAGATMFGGPAAGAATAGITNSMRNSYGTPKVGRNSSPYGQQGQQPQFMR